MSGTNLKTGPLTGGLTDSQNIPKDLLSTLKNDVIVDDFIYHLKKYSLITNKSSINSSQAISIHRSTHVLPPYKWSRK